MIKNRLKYYVDKNNVNISDMAKAVGTSRSVIYKMQEEDSNINNENWSKVMEFLEVSFDDMFYFEPSSFKLNEKQGFCKKISKEKNIFKINSYINQENKSNGNIKDITLTSIVMIKDKSIYFYYYIDRLFFNDIYRLKYFQEAYSSMDNFDILFKISKNLINKNELFKNKTVYIKYYPDIVTLTNGENNYMSREVPKEISKLSKPIIITKSDEKGNIDKNIKEYSNDQYLLSEIFLEKIIPDYIETIRK